MLRDPRNRAVARLCLQILFMLMPWTLRRRLLKITFGYDLHERSYIGYSLVDTNTCVMKEHSRIGHFNLIRNLDDLTLSEDAGIGTFNNVTGYPIGRKGSFGHLEDRQCRLFLGAMAGLTSRHFVDCTAGVYIGRRATVAGIRTTILTHSIDLQECRQDAAEVTIGNGCFIGTNVILLPGVKIAENCVLAAGTVAQRSLTNEGTLYAGNPAQEKRRLDVLETRYFHRSQGNVS